MKSLLKSLVIKSTNLAQEKLAKKTADPDGKILLKFAHHIWPKYRELLLLRARLKYKLKVPPPEEREDEEEILELLEEATDLLDENNSIGQHLKTVCFAMIQRLKPGHEEALIQLMKLEDKGLQVDLEELLKKKLSDLKEVEYDPNDQRYVISNIKKSIPVSSSTPWTNTWVKVEKGKVIKVKAEKLWGFGDGPFPAVDADGFPDVAISTNIKSNSPKIKYKKVNKVYSKTSVKTIKKQKIGSQANPGALLAKIGKSIYPVGKEASFIVNETGILYFGPFEWDDYSDNTGELFVSFEVADR